MDRWPPPDPRRAPSRSAALGPAACLFLTLQSAAHTVPARPCHCVRGKRQPSQAGNPSSRRLGRHSALPCFQTTSGLHSPAVQPGGGETAATKVKRGGPGAAGNPAGTRGLGRAGGTPSPGGHKARLGPTPLPAGCSARSACARRWDSGKGATRSAKFRGPPVPDPVPPRLQSQSGGQARGGLRGLPARPSAHPLQPPPPPPPSASPSRGGPPGPARRRSPEARRVPGSRRRRAPLTPRDAAPPPGLTTGHRCWLCAPPLARRRSPSWGSRIT